MFFRNLNWDIVGQRNLWFGLSAVVIIAGIIALFVHHGLPLATVPLSKYPSIAATIESATPACQSAETSCFSSAALEM